MLRLLAASMAVSMVALALPAAADAAPDKEPPAASRVVTMKTRDEMLKLVTDAYARSPVASLVGKRDDHLQMVSFAELKGHGRHVFLAWYCPTSGEATCQVFVFAYEREKSLWRLQKEHHFHGTQDISVELTHDDRLILRDVKRKEIHVD